MDRIKEQLIICGFSLILILSMMIIFIPSKSNNNILLNTGMATGGIVSQENPFILFMDASKEISSKDLILLIPCGILLLFFSLWLILKILKDK